MKWQNLKNCKCPICNGWLERGEGKIFYQCLKHKPEFRITQQKYEEIVDGSYQALRNKAQNDAFEVDKNLSELNNL